MSARLNTTLTICAAAITLAAGSTASAQSAPNCPTMRKINIGVSVAPPNVVHTSPYVAKGLGFFDVYDQNILNLLCGPCIRLGMTVEEARAELPAALADLLVWVTKVNSLE